MFGGGALSSTGAAVVGSLIVRTVRAQEKLFSVACARRVNEILDRALRIFRTAPCDFVIALEFFPSSPIKRGAWEFCVPLPPPTRYNSLEAPFQVYTVVVYYTNHWQIYYRVALR